jgi:ribosomal protein L37AE/L43A
MRWSRFTIAQVMMVIAVFASLLAVPQLAGSSDRIVMVCLVGLLTVLVLINMLVEMVFGKQCPACSRWTLRRLARHRRYYRCSECGGRFKRFGLSPWLDASGPEDEARYRKRTEAGNWRGFAAPKDLGATTSGRLLRNKRTQDLQVEVKHQSHPPARPQRLVDAERKARNALNHLRDLQE